MFNKKTLHDLVFAFAVFIVVLILCITTAKIIDAWFDEKNINWKLCNIVFIFISVDAASNYLIQQTTRIKKLKRHNGTAPLLFQRPKHDNRQAKAGGQPC